MYGIVYLTLNLVNGKKYIGQHKCKTEHDSYIGSGKTIKKAIEKYGYENFKRYILYRAESPEELDKMEIAFISAFRATERDDYYNIAEGGSTNRAMKGANNPSFGKRGPLSPHYGRKRSAETCRRISEGQKGRIVVVSEETKQKISKTMKEHGRKPCSLAYKKLKGRKLSRPGGRPMRKILCVELGVVFESQNDAARKLNIPQSNIYKVLKGIRPRAGGYSFVYAESEVMPNDSKTRRNNELGDNGRTTDVLQDAS